MDPQGPSQPKQDTSYTVPGNPASKEPAEDTAAASKAQHHKSSETIDYRTEHDVPSTNTSDARPSALNAGDSGPLKEKSLPDSDNQNYTPADKDPNLEGEQMRAPGEGEVADAVAAEVNSGSGGTEPGFTEHLDRKKAEHIKALEEKGESLEEREKEDWTGKKDTVDIEGALSGRGVPVVLSADTQNLSGGAREGLGDA